VTTLLAGRDGWVEVRGERIADLGAGAPPRRATERVDGTLARGLVDLQVNGGAGKEVTGGPQALDAIDALQLAHGVTSYLPTIISTDDETAARAVADIARRVADPRSPVEGAHLEGPFISPDHRGAHRPEHLRVPGDGLPPAYASPAVRLVTLAPELPGALDLIAMLRARGIAVSLGHSGCDAATARRALDAGARLVTHLFNAMGPLHHRAPGLAGVALSDRRVRIGLIADGVHVDPAVLTIVRRAAGGRVVLVSDASTASLAGTPLREAGGRITTPDGVLAGSSITLDEAARRWVRLAGATPAGAHAAASARPARAVGLPGSPRPGDPADLVVLDDDGRALRVMRRGRWLA
jgi:N-acetylglucosamine-6-phosphate deacetylase